MARLRVFLSRLFGLPSGRKRDADLRTEIDAHIAEASEEFERQGVPADQARRLALAQFGGVTQTIEAHRNARGLPTLDALLHDTRYAARMLWKSPVFTGIVTLTLALGIGANTALFSLVDNLLLRSLPIPHADRLVLMQVFGFDGNADGNRNDKPLVSEVTAGAFDAIRSRNEIFDEVVGYLPLFERPAIVVNGNLEPRRDVQFISTNYFTGLGVSPVFGRTPLASDNNVAVISARWWRSRFGERTDVVGRAVTIDQKDYTIIGVAPLRFHGFDLDRSADIWIVRRSQELMPVARLQPAATPVQAQAAVHPILRQEVPQEYQSEPMETEVLGIGGGLSNLRQEYQAALLALMGLVTLVLLTMCASIGNLVVLRNTGRRRELTVRAALGAGRSRLVGQSLVESLMLATAGCIAGLVLARWGVTLIVSMLPMPIPPDGLMFYADTRIIGFAAGVAALSVLLFGAVPAWRTTAVDLTGALRSGQGATAPVRARRAGHVLVACQVALSVLLLVGAGLFIQTLRNLSRLDVGFKSDQLLQVSLDTRFAGYQEKDLPAVNRLLLERMSAVAGVRLVSSTDSHVMQPSSTRMGIPLRGLGRTIKLWEAMSVSPQFFETMGIELVRGRLFTGGDLLREPGLPGEWRQQIDSGAWPRGMAASLTTFMQANGPFVINEAFARHYLPGVDPVATTSPVIGIVNDVKVFGVKDDIVPTMFLISRRPEHISALQVRASGSPSVLTSAIRETIQSINPKLFTRVATLGEGIDRSIAKERMVAAISGFFGVLGLALACIGIFGVASGAIAARSKEIGIRRALGAGGWRVIGESLRGTLLVVAIGLLAGGGAAFTAVNLGSHVVADLVFGLTATDVANVMTAIGVMVVVALLACTLPALRAARIDPLAVIREE